MAVIDTEHLQLQVFTDNSNFKESGALILDLDGTALHEREGKIYIPDPIKKAVEAVHQLGRPIVLNTLRFPLSLIRSIGWEWYTLTHAPIPTVLLNGSLLGYLEQGEGTELVFREVDAFALGPEEIDRVMDGVVSLVEAGLKDIALFYYPRNWQRGEIIWTPQSEKITELEDRYRSASAVVSTSLRQLRETLKKQEVCMIFLLVNAEGDRLMAYQHTNRHSYFTRKGVDKRYGVHKLARHLKISLQDSVGAGDTELDNFLSTVGLAIRVRKPHLPYEGVSDTVKVANSYELGELLIKLAGMQHSH
jgi:hydroxymethylpyrimidine pyrophosphatase-like HAD family hydrolase